MLQKKIKSYKQSCAKGQLVGFKHLLGLQQWWGVRTGTTNGLLCIGRVALKIRSLWPRQGVTLFLRLSIICLFRMRFAAENSAFFFSRWLITLQKRCEKRIEVINKNYIRIYQRKNVCNHL
jgi:hypothetical protein